FSRTELPDQKRYCTWNWNIRGGSRLASAGSAMAEYYDDERRLVFAGKVGTGFSIEVARSLRQQLERIERAAPAFAPAPPTRIGRQARWVKPSLVGEVAFSEWTTDGTIRHPSFQGLRRDKPARDVRREKPA
ncbi:MAG: hypothetical protein ABI818_18285, partial [Acidobacteriota bacterium]